MFGSSSELKRAVQMMTEAAPRSDLLALLCEQISEQVGYEIAEHEREIDSLQKSLPEEDPGKLATIAFRQGAIRTLQSEMKRWRAVSDAFENAPETRPANPANYAFVRIGERD